MTVQHHSSADMYNHQVLLPHLLATLPLAACLFDEKNQLVQFNALAATVLQLDANSIGKNEQQLYQIIETAPGLLNTASTVHIAFAGKPAFPVQIDQQVFPATGNGAACTIKYYQVVNITTSVHALAQHMGNMPFGMIGWELERVTFWSEQAENIFGWTADEAIGKNWMELGLVAPDDELLAEVRSKIRAGSQFEKRVNRNRTKDGKYIYCHWYTSAMHHPTGKLSEVMTLVEDVTEKLVAQKSLQQKEEELALVYDNTASGLFLVEIRNGEPYFASVNKSLLASYGIKASQVVGRKCAEAMPLPPTAPMVLHMTRVIRTGQMAQWSEERIWANGQSQSVNITLVPVLDSEGKCYRVAGSIHDETLLKRQAQELEQLNNELQRLSRHQLQVREEERHSVAREVHDELGQLLTALKIDLSMLRQDLIQNEELSKRLESLLDVLDITMGTVRRVVTDLHPMVLHDLGLIAGLQWLIRQSTQKTGLPVQFHKPEILEEPSANISLTLYRICQEALTNIVRHAAATEAVVHLYTDEQAIHLRISDNGKGFDPLHKKEDSFGLMGMKERAGICNGSIQISSAPSHGTTVTIIVPKKQITNE